MSSISGNTYKTVLDNWNSSHSLELKTKQDKDLTTFIALWGRYRYLIAPMGLWCSGDTITDRMDRLYSDMVRMHRCVDALIYDYTVEEQFYRTCVALDLGSNHSAIFSSWEVEYVGLMM